MRTCIITLETLSDSVAVSMAIIGFLYPIGCYTFTLPIFDTFIDNKIKFA